MNILVVEADQSIREGIAAFLSEFGYTMVEAKDGREALLKFNKELHLVILDIQIPFVNGLEVLKEIRKQSKLPVLILTAFSDDEYKIDAFTSLADGYMEKPFSLPLLKARIDSLIQKSYGQTDKFLYKNVEVDFSGYTAKLDGKPVDMNAKEVEILKYLWKETEEIPFDRVIDVYIKELRRKLKLDCIFTIRNVGYKLEKE